MLQPLLFIEKNSECIKELLIWIQDIIKARNLHDPVYIESKKYNIEPFRKFLRPLKIAFRKLRKIRKRYASIIHGDKNPTFKYLKYLSKVALRLKLLFKTPKLFLKLV